MELSFYNNLLTEIKSRIRTAQVKATLAANAEMIAMYWDIGKIISQRQQEQGWGANVIPRLANDIKNELSEIKGFSVRNLKCMVQFYKEYENETPIGQQAVAQLPWGHLLLLMQKIKSISIRAWYTQQIIENGWSRDILGMMIKSDLHLRQSETTHNFKQTLPNEQSDLIVQALKDPYIFDFLTIAQPFSEKELENELIKHIEKFLLELGAGFAFVGRQYHIEVRGKDFYIDLLFYHLKLRRFVVIDLKRGEFKPEYAGKMNFYCSAIDDHLKHHTDQSTIGLILCQTKDAVMAEYTLRNVHSPIGVSEFELTRALPENLKSSLPSIESIENELKIHHQ